MMSTLKKKKIIQLLNSTFTADVENVISELLKKSQRVEIYSVTEFLRVYKDLVEIEDLISIFVCNNIIKSSSIKDQYANLENSLYYSDISRIILIESESIIGLYLVYGYSLSEDLEIIVKVLSEFIHGTDVGSLPDNEVSAGVPEINNKFARFMPIPR